MPLAAVLVLLVLDLLGGTAAPAAAAPAAEPPAAEAAPAAAAFEDVAAAAGVARPHRNRSFDNPYAQVMEGYTALGAAAAVADYDGDGDEDLFVTDSADGAPNLLYRNRGDGSPGKTATFEEVAAAGVAAGNDAGNASADALWLDYDDDGRPDLFVVRFGRSLLYRNRGDGTFEDVTAKAGLGAYANSIAAIAFDYDLDGDVDLFVADYFAPVDLFDPETPRFFPESFETAANGGGVTLYRNDGGRFVDVTKEAGLAHHTGWSLDLGHADLDHDGDDDLYVAADFGTDRLFVNRGDGSFEDATERAIGIDTKKGMNAEWADFDGDGRFDVYVTNITDDYMREGNFLWRNEGDGTFTDLARETGTWDTGWGWAGKFFDFDDDGWLDLYVVNGWVSAGSENYVLDIFELIVRPDVDLADARNWPPMGDKTLSGYQRNKLFRNLGGTLFRDEAAAHGVDSLRDGRGVAVADFDGDGRLDLFVANANAEPHLFRNRHPQPGRWIELELVGTKSNREAIGARVKLTAGGRDRWSFVDGGNGFASQSSRRRHFGLGDAEKADAVEVLWPSGARQTFRDLAAGRRYRIVEGKAEAEVVGEPKPLGKSPAADDTPRSIDPKTGGPR
ncbi:MAG TPA: CRTAC1 family protein [Thermoanaerobaculia bacterium]